MNGVEHTTSAMMKTGYLSKFLTSEYVWRLYVCMTSVIWLGFEEGAIESPSTLVLILACFREVRGATAVSQRAMTHSS